MSEVETKVIHLDPAMDNKAEVMRCSLPGHRPSLPFYSFEEYDLHYTKSHLNRCTACRCNFPTSHLLSLHQTEFHDPFVSVLRERGEKIYACFAEDCDEKCSSPRERTMHLMDEHMFPKNYDFHVVKDGIDRKTSMLREEKPERKRRRSLTLEKKSKVQSAEWTTKGVRTVMDIDQRETKTVELNLLKTQPLAPPAPELDAIGPSTAPDEAMEIEDLVGAMSALRFLPPSVRFGKGKGRPKSSKR